MLKNNFKNINLNREICEFIGAFIGDGYLGNYGQRKNQYLVGIAGDQKLDEDYLKNYLVPLIKRNFPFANPTLLYRHDENTLMLRVYSIKLYRFFEELGFKAGKKYATVTIPKQILSDDKFMNSTIRGIFDTDGCVFLDKRSAYRKPYPRITLQSASIPLINQLERYLLNYFTLYVYKKNRDNNRNYLEIYGYEQLERFLKKIGFSNKRHLDKVTTIMPL